MKKYYGILLILVIFLMTTEVFAGNIPEELLGNDDALLYFAKVITYKPDEKIPQMEIVVTDKIKGDVAIGSKMLYLYPQIMGNFEIISDKVYLFAYVNEENAYVYETSSLDTKKLKLLHVSGSVHERLQKYINNGDFKKAEEERKYITLSEFMRLDKERECSVIFRNKDNKYVVDKEMFFNLADEIILTDIDDEVAVQSNDGYIEGIEGIYIEVLYEHQPHESVIKHSYAFMTDDFKFDRYSLFMSRLPCRDYSVSEEDGNKLLALINNENVIDMNIEKNTDIAVVIAISVILIFAVGFVLGYAVIKKKRS